MSPPPDNANLANAAALVAAGLTKTFHLAGHHIPVLRGLDLCVAPGEWVALTGKSGCGKTTLLHLLGILDKPDGGELVLFGEATGRNPFRRARMRREHIGFVFQSFQLFPELNALENVTLASRFAGHSGADSRDRAANLLHRVGLDARLKHRPTELSGGEQQRLGLARALMNDPQIILADEPTGNLDPQNSAEIMEILKDLRDEEKRAIVMVTHDRGLTEYCDRRYTLEDGVLKD